MQLGYNGEAEPLIFVPEWSNGGLGIPERGNLLDAAAVSKLTLLIVAEGQASQTQPAGGLVH